MILGRGIKMRLCSYVVRIDKGLAPNPFYRYCTLAICTPNHMGNRNEKGDWFLGTTSVKRGNKIIYAMEVDCRLHFNDYYSDPRFEKKKPIIDGTWRQRCGDNMYYQENNGKWRQHPTAHHATKASMTQDLKHPYVFVSKHFFYFGEKAPEIPDKFKGLIWSRSGCKCSHNPEVVKAFIKWMESNYNPGIIGLPMDRDVNKRKDQCEKQSAVC